MTPEMRGFEGSNVTADNVFEDTVKNLLKMKPKPHDEGKADEKKGDGADRRPSASRSSKEDH